MKKTIKKTGVIAILAITIMVVAAGCGKKEPKVYTPNDIYQFRKVSDIDKDIYYVNNKGVEMTKRQYDELFHYYDRSSIFFMSKEEFDLIMNNEWPMNGSGVFSYKEDLEEVGTFSQHMSIVKVKEETYKNTEEKKEELDRDGAAEQALNEIDYEPVAIRVAGDSDENMWRVSLFFKDDGEEAIYTNVYMTEKGKTELITIVTGFGLT